MKLAWKQIIAAFVLGAVLGVLGAMRCMPFGLHGWKQNPEKFQHRLMEKFTSRLGLNSEQQQKVSVILQDTRAKMEALREEIHPRFREIRDSAKSRIRELLTPDQQAKFDVMAAEMDARFAKRHAA